MRWVVPFLALTTVVETVAVPGFVIQGFRPELSLVVVIGWATLRGWEEGLVIGLLGGFFADALSAAPFGLNLVRFGLVGWCAGLLVARLIHANILLVMGLAACGSLFGFFVSVLGLQAGGWSVAWERALLADGLPSAVFAVASMVLVYPFLRNIAVRQSVSDESPESV